MPSFPRPQLGYLGSLVIGFLYVTRGVVTAFDILDSAEKGLVSALTGSSVRSRDDRATLCSPSADSHQVTRSAGVGFSSPLLPHPHCL